MNARHLVDMVNDISTYFGFDPDDDGAVDEVVSHIRKYWEPRMRSEIVAHLQAGGADLQPLSRKAIERIAEIDGKMAA